MKFFTILFSLFAFSLSALAVTSVEFPLTSMFNGALYTKSFKAQAVNTIVTDGTNAWIGSDQTITPSGGTNPIVGLTPNDYRIVFSDAVTPWRIRVPNTTNRLNALDLTIGPLPTFLLNLNPNLVATNVDNATGTNVNLSGTFTGNGSALTNVSAYNAAYSSGPPQSVATMGLSGQFTEARNLSFFYGTGENMTPLPVFYWSDLTNQDVTGVAPSGYAGNTNFAATQGFAIIASSNTNRFVILSPTAFGVYGVNNTSGTGGTLFGDYVRLQVGNSGTAGSVQPFVVLKGDGSYIAMRKSDNSTEFFRVSTNGVTTTVPIIGPGYGLSFTNAAGAAFRLVVNAATNGFTFVPQ